MRRHRDREDDIIQVLCLGEEWGEGKVAGEFCVWVRMGGGLERWVTRIKSRNLCVVHRFSKPRQTQVRSPLQDHQQVEKKRRHKGYFVLVPPRNQELPETSTPTWHLASYLFQLLGPTQPLGHHAQQLASKPSGAQSGPQQEQEDVKQVVLMPLLLGGVGFEVRCPVCLENMVDPAHQPLGCRQGVGVPDDTGSHSCSLVPVGRNRDGLFLIWSSKT